MTSSLKREDVYMSDVFIGYRGGASGGGGIEPGCIVIWSGTSTDIPTGWALCDGTNGTPDLRDRFVVGAGNGYTVGSTGGSNGVTLSISEMPNHGHSMSGLSIGSAGSHTHNIMKYTNTGAYGQQYVSIETSSSSSQSSITIGQGSQYMQSEGSHSHSIGGSLSNSGSGSSHENRPPYYALCYIIKL